MFLQAIVIGDDAYEVEKASRSFANKHIFPGGCLPSHAADHRARSRQRDPGRRPATTSPTTTRARSRAGASASTTPGPALRPRGYDERFGRLWNFYLAFSEGGFRERRIRDLQIVLAKPGWRAKDNEWRSPTRAPAAASLSS